MDSFCRFPLFVDLQKKRAVVVGGGAVACRRIGVLREFGADVTVIAPQIQERLSGVSYRERTYRPGDLEGAFLAVAATNDRAVNHAVGEEAGRRDIPVSVADCRAECTFFFPAVCTGAGLVAGVVSDGTDHRRAAAGAEAIRRTLRELEGNHEENSDWQPGE